MPLKDSGAIPTVHSAVKTLNSEPLLQFGFTEKNSEASKPNSGRFLQGLIFRKPDRPHVGARLSNVIDPLTGDSCNFTQDKSLYDKSHACLYLVTC